MQLKMLAPSARNNNDNLNVFRSYEIENDNKFFLASCQVKVNSKYVTYLLFIMLLLLLLLLLLSPLQLQLLLLLLLLFLLIITHFPPRSFFTSGKS